MALLCAAACLSAAEVPTVTLREEALVVGPSITLGEVAEIEGADADALADVEISDAAQPGSTRRLARSLVALRVRNAGLTDREVLLQGPATVLATTSYREIAPEEIVRSLRAHVLAEMPWKPELTEIDIPMPRDALIIPDADYEIQWRANPQYDYVGQGTFRGAVMLDGSERQAVLCRARIEAYGDMVVAARDIARRNMVTEADLTMRKQRLSQLPRGAITCKSDALGLLTRKTFFQGQALTRHGLEPPTVVKRNQEVTVEMRHGAVWVQSRALALNNGRPGDMIRFSNPETKQQFQGYVREDGTVVVH